MDNFVNLV